MRAGRCLGVWNTLHCRRAASIVYRSGNRNWPIYGKVCIQSLWIQTLISKDWQDTCLQCLGILREVLPTALPVSQSASAGSALEVATSAGYKTACKSAMIWSSACVWAEISVKSFFLDVMMAQCMHDRSKNNRARFGDLYPRCNFPMQWHMHIVLPEKTHCGNHLSALQTQFLTIGYFSIEKSISTIITALHQSILSFSTRIIEKYIQTKDTHCYFTLIKTEPWCIYFCATSVFWNPSH